MYQIDNKKLNLKSKNYLNKYLKKFDNYEMFSLKPLRDLGNFIKHVEYNITPKTSRHIS